MLYLGLASSPKYHLNPLSTSRHHILWMAIPSTQAFHNYFTLFIISCGTKRSVSASEQPVSHCKGKPKYCLALFYQKEQSWSVLWKETRKWNTNTTFFLTGRRGTTYPMQVPWPALGRLLRGQAVPLSPLKAPGHHPTFAGTSTPKNLLQAPCQVLLKPFTPRLTTATHNHQVFNR